MGEATRHQVGGTVRRTTLPSIRGKVLRATTDRGIQNMLSKLS